MSGTQMDGLDLILHVAAFRGMWVRLINQGSTRLSRRGTDTPRGWLSFINDEAIEGGPGEFGDECLRDCLAGARVAIISADMTDEAGLVISSILALPTVQKVTLVVTQPQRHAHWTWKTISISGDAPVFHLADESLDSSAWSGVETPGVQA